MGYGGQHCCFGSGLSLSRYPLRQEDLTKSATVSLLAMVSLAARSTRADLASPVPVGTLDDILMPERTVHRDLSRLQAVLISYHSKLGRCSPVIWVTNRLGDRRVGDKPSKRQPTATHFGQICDRSINNCRTEKDKNEAHEDIYISNPMSGDKQS